MEILWWFYVIAFVSLVATFIRSQRFFNYKMDLMNRLGNIIRKAPITKGNNARIDQILDEYDKVNQVEQWWHPILANPKKRYKETSLLLTELEKNNVYN